MRHSNEEEETETLVRQMKIPFKLDLVRSMVHIHGIGRVIKNSHNRTLKVIKRKKVEETGKNINNQ